MGCMGPSFVVGLTIMGVVVGTTGPWLGDCQVMPYVVVASLLVDGARCLNGWVQGLSQPGLVLAHRWAGR